MNHKLPFNGNEESIMVAVVGSVQLYPRIFHLVSWISPIDMINVASKNMSSLFDQLSVAKFFKCFGDNVLRMS